MKFVEFVWQNVSVRDKVESGSAKFLLSLTIVEAKTVFPCDLIRHWEVIYALKFVQAFIQKRLAAGAGPKDVPLVRISVIELVRFKKGPHQFSVALHKFVKHFTVFNVVGLLLNLVSWRQIVKELTICNWFYCL